MPVKDISFRKQKFDVKQLKLKKSLKHVWQLIISILNATLEAPWLSSCITRISVYYINELSNSSLVRKIKKHVPHQPFFMHFNLFIYVTIFSI